MLFKNGAVATQRPWADGKPHGWDELLDCGQTVVCVSNSPRQRREPHPVKTEAARRSSAALHQHYP